MECFCLTIGAVPVAWLQVPDQRSLFNGVTVTFLVMLPVRRPYDYRSARIGVVVCVSLSLPVLFVLCSSVVPICVLAVHAGSGGA